MDEPPERKDERSSGEQIPFTATSAHRKVKPARPLGTRVILWTLAAVVVTIVAFELSRSPPQPPPPPPPPPSPTASPAPRVTPSPTATPAEVFGDWVEEEPTPTPEPTLFPTFTPRPPATPTRPPTLADCVDFTWWAQQNLVPLNQVRISIEVTNNCGRDIGQMDLWFQISGWRDGAAVQTVRAHPLDELRRRASTDIAVGLPGSIDWYDEITVEILPAAR